MPLLFGILIVLLILLVVVLIIKAVWKIALILIGVVILICLGECLWVNRAILMQRLKLKLSNLAHSVRSRR